MGHLAARVHAGVGAARHGELHGLGEPQHGRERLLEHLLHGAHAAALPGPARELGAVVRQVESYPDHPRLPE